MFPLAGNLNGINPNPYPQLPQHGVARSTPAWKMISSERGSNWSFLEVLDSRDMAACLRNAYPFSFGVKLEAVAKELDGITIALEAHNNGPADMPVAMGLHPYHPCPADRKHEIRFRFSGGEIIEAAVQSWTNGGTIAVPNPRTSLIIEIPELGTLEVTIGETFQQIWVWSLPNRPFFCLEFAMRGEGGLVDDPHLVSAGDTVTGTVAYRLLA
jgi:galactose mutarotase-like enzyme